MNEKEMMLRRLSGAQFAMWETHIFLDTHPNNDAALAALEKYTEKYKKLMAEYEQKYGPLVSGTVFAEGGFKWLNDPWPWEGDAD